MIINKVEINNFFCYVEENIFNFDKGLNIISAKNSGGKSHLFNAFHWTFFNKVYTDKESDTTKKEWKNASNLNILPDYIAYISDNESTIKSSVKITLTAEYHGNKEVQNDLVEYHFDKEALYRKVDNEIIMTSSPDLQIWYVKDGETVYLDKGEHTWFINSIFPVSIRKFMWFQGETVDELYDFSNPSTLKHAINEISYFPIYENMVNVAKKSIDSISRKIDREIKRTKKLSEDQEKTLNLIDFTRNKIIGLRDKIIEGQKELENVKESIFKEEEKLKGFDVYTDLKTKQVEFDYQIKSTQDKIDELNYLGKQNFISKWMLNKCDDLIRASKDNLDLLSDMVKSYQKSENPVPMTLPGPEYVQKMLEDKVCYICERQVEYDSPAYNALKSRMEDFKNNQIQKTLADNLTDLNRARRILLSELPDITNEVNKNEDAIDKLMTLRNRIKKKKDNLYSDSGISSSEEIKLGSESAAKILNKIHSLTSSKTGIESRLRAYDSEIRSEEYSLEKLNKHKETFITDQEGRNISEVEAQKYIKLIHDALEDLKSEALKNLIEEITIESNILYSKYLGGNTQGKIEIDRGVRIIDKKTNKSLSNLNTAELTAQKLAVANSFLSLSAKKMNRSFPLLADAPTSQFDEDNTLSLTENLSNSFDQIIIMSKDYNTLQDSERQQFIERANICKYYELTNDLIDKSGIDSRTNKKTYINTVK